MPEPTRWRKRPVVIEAMQWIGDPEPIMHWITREGGTVEFVARGADHQLRRRDEMYPHGPRGVAAGAPTFLVIDTLEGPMRADHLDFVIRGVASELYPCKADIFAATYEPAGYGDA